MHAIVETNRWNTPGFLHHDPCIIPVEINNNIENLQPCNGKEN